MNTDEEIARLNGDLNKAWEQYDKAIEVLVHRGQQRGDDALKRLEEIRERHSCPGPFCVVCGILNRPTPKSEKPK